MVDRSGRLRIGSNPAKAGSKRGNQRFECYSQVFDSDRSIAAPIGFRFSFLLEVLPLASTAPNTGGGSDLHSQGGCQQANLLALRLSPHDVIYSCSTKRQNVFCATIRRPKTNPNSTRYIAYFSSSKFGSPNEEDLSGDAHIGGEAASHGRTGETGRSPLSIPGAVPTR